MGAEFDDGKDEGALRTIGEVAKALDIKQHVLRYWEQQFPMLQPLKRSGGRRYYRPEDIVLVEEINRLVNSEGYTLKGAKKALSGRGKPPAADKAVARQETPVNDAPTETAEPVTENDKVPTDGGVDAFFGRPAAADARAVADVQPEEASEESESTIAADVPDEVIAQLKSIRSRLAAALDA